MNPRSDLPVVVWDIDDVLNNLMFDWLAHLVDSTRSARCPKYEDLTANPPHVVLGISEQDYLGSLDAFRLARYDTLVPRADVVTWFERNGDRARHVALTAVPQAFAHLSASWVVRHFGTWIRTFAFVPSSRGASGRGHDVTKADYLTWLGVGDVFVDDRDENADAARSLGLACVVVPQPWNGSKHPSLQSALDRVSALIGFETAG